MARIALRAPINQRKRNTKHAMTHLVNPAKSPAIPCPSTVSLRTSVPATGSVMSYLMRNKR